MEEKEEQETHYIYMEEKGRGGMEEERGFCNIKLFIGVIL